MCRPDGSSLVLSQQLELLSTLFFQQLCRLRPLLVKQGYLSPFSVKFILNELGDGGMLFVWTQSRQHLHLRLLALSSNSDVRRHPIRFDSNGSSSRALDESLPLHHPIFLSSLDGLQSATRCNGASIACTVTVQDTYTEHRVRWCLETSRTRVVQTKVSIRDKGKSKPIFSIVNLLSINHI